MDVANTESVQRRCCVRTNSYCLQLNLTNFLKCDGLTGEESVKWVKVGHMERMEGELLTKRADALRVEDRRRRGSLRLRWEDCVKRDLVGVGNEIKG